MATLRKTAFAALALASLLAPSAALAFTPHAVHVGPHTAFAAVRSPVRLPSSPVGSNVWQRSPVGHPAARAVHASPVSRTAFHRLAKRS
jgi:hypothetical protein